MTSERQINANRANARASTGPKSVRGRARSAGNARRHGLSLPIHSDPFWCKEVEALAREIAGRAANAEINHLARQIAEAQIDLRRVRSARHQFLSNKLRDPYYDSHAHTRRNISLLHSLLRPNTPEVPPEILMGLLMASKPEGPHKFALILSQETKHLIAMDRYERRALARRELAVRAFDRRMVESGR
jgi:hypothetical protein